MHRFLGLLVAVLLGAIVSTGFATSASARSQDTLRAAKSKKCKAGKKGKKCRAKPRLKVYSTKASTLLKGKFKVRVSAPSGSKVRLSSASSTFDEPGVKLIKPKTVKVGKKGKRFTKLRLTAPSKSAVSGCEARTLTVKVKRNGRKAKVNREMNRDTSDCRLQPVDLSRADDCDFIAQPKHGMCMLPFPSDYYTRDDAASRTGKRIHFTEGGMPQNKNGVPISPGVYGESDGFSQGSGIAVKVPGLDTAAAVDANNLVPINHQGEYSLPDQKAMVIDTSTGDRWPIWANIDSNASDPKDALLEIKPAMNFDAKGRYIVALRNLTDVEGNALQAPEAFRYYRDDLPSDQPEVNQRREHFEGIFETLKGAGVKRNDLYLAWDFTVSSNENNYERVISMRDRAFAELGDTTMDDQIEQGMAPDFTITNVTNLTIGQNSRVARKVKGTYEVPCFLEPNCAPGGTMNLNAEGLPIRNGTMTANLECIIPRVALDGAPVEMRPMIYGHGLFGKADGVNGSVNPQLAQDHGMVNCATDEIGMSGYDIGSVAGALVDLSQFKLLPDRLAQGIINELFLARLMFHPGGLGTDAAFQNAGQPVMENENVYYMGASQGGIMGGALTAVSPDFIQSSLLVGAMNYSSLLPRSVDFDLYADVMYPAYPDEMSHPLLFGLMQILWDRSEPNGYAHRMTDNPPPNTPEHKVTLIIALGDHEVTNFAAEVEARTVGMKTNDPPLDPGRWPDMDILHGIERIQDSEYPYHGSNIIYFDGGPIRPDPNNAAKTIGTTPPPFANVPNRAGQNPHGAPGGATDAVEMTASFLQPNGYIEDICAPGSCYSDVWNGLP